jgi:hypothetical protein
MKKSFLILNLVSEPTIGPQIVFFILKSLISKYLKKNKGKIYACFVDLRKAFDSLWHNGLIYKLMINRIGVKFLNIINNMYNCSQSAIKIQNKISSFLNLERGVKQGGSISYPVQLFYK